MRNILKNAEQTVTYLEGQEKVGELMKFILFYKENNDGLSPTNKEMRDKLGLSAGTVHNLLRGLEKKGFIEIERGKSRGIKVKGGRWRFEGETGNVGARRTGDAISMG